MPTKAKAKKKQPKRKLNDKQRKFLSLFTANMSKKKPDTLVSVMMQAGYSETSANKQTSILSRIINTHEGKEVVDRIGLLRDKALLALEKKDFDAMHPDDLRKMLSSLIYGHQLLSGRATSRAEIDVKLEATHKAYLLALIHESREAQTRNN